MLGATLELHHVYRRGYVVHKNGHGEKHKMSVEREADAQAAYPHSQPWARRVSSVRRRGMLSAMWLPRHQISNQPRLS